MREIKFRAWNNVLKVMVNEAVQIGYRGVHAPSMVEADVIARSDKYEIMQYTGRKDKVGKDIYEGDLFNPWNDDYVYQIEWDDEHGGFICKQLVGVKRDCDLSQSEDGTVIGNIYENPELLK